MPTQDCLIYRDDREFIVLGEVDRTELYRGSDAVDAIQWGIDFVAGRAECHGGRVRLSRGRYPIHRTITMAAGVHLSGSGRGTILDVAGTCETGIRLEAVKGAVVSELAIQGGATDVSADARPALGLDIVNAADCRVRGVLAQGFARYGLLMRDNAILCRITDCSFADNLESNIRLAHLDKGPFGNWIPNTVIGCTTYGGGKGVEIERCIVLTINGVQVHQSMGPAFHIYGIANATSLIGCRTYQVTGIAVLWEDSHELSIVGNVFSWHTEAGIVLRRCRWGTISGNNVIDTGSLNPGGPCMETKFGDLPDYPPSFPGISIEDCRGLTVNGNAIFQWPVVPPMTHGIEEDAASANNIITGNHVNFYRGRAVESLGAETLAAPDANAGYAASPLFRNPTPGVDEPIFMQPEHAIQSFEPHLTRRLIDRGYD